MSISARLHAGIKLHVCTCLQCKAQKAKRGNRRAKKRIKRYISKKRRTMPEGKIFNYYWS